MIFLTCQRVNAVRKESAEPLANGFHHVHVYINHSRRRLKCSILRNKGRDGHEKV